MVTIGVSPALIGGRVAPAPVPPAVAPLAALALDVLPPIAQGRAGARFVATVTNVGRERVAAHVSAVPAAPWLLKAAVAQGAWELDPGQSLRAHIDVRPRRPQLLRPEQEHLVSVRVRSDDPRPVATRTVVYVQRRGLPLWAAALVVLAVGAVVAAFALLSGGATVPDVRGASDAATAERSLRAEGLRLDPQLRTRRSSDVRPGTVLDQIPAPGTSAGPGDGVTLLVAVGAGKRVMPALAGQTVARAVSVLEAAGLTAGPVMPAGAPASSSIVSSQLPEAGASVARGAPVTLFARPARPGEARAAAAAPPAGGKTHEVPAVDGREAGEYVRAIAAAGLAPAVKPVTSSLPQGTLVGVNPRPGTLRRAGERVRLLVSGGVPELAYDTGSVVKLFDPLSGRTLHQAAPPESTAVEPSWSATGRRLLYRSGRRLVLASARLAGRGAVLYDGPVTYAAATFAPSPTGDVIALVRRAAGDGDLCFARVASSRLRPRCSVDKRWDLGRQISWRHDGRELLVFGVRRGKRGRFGIVRYRSARAFSTDPADWHGEIATDTSRAGRGVIAAAYSPAGRHVALVTNASDAQFQLLMTSSDDLRHPSAPPLPVRACEVAWRPDGRELAVVQSDDACERPVGEIVRIDPDHPRAAVTVSNQGRHPVYQPFSYAGPRGLS